MKHVSILILNHAILSTIDATKQLLVRVNDFLIYHAKDPLFEVELIGLAEETRIDRTYLVRSDKILKDVEHTDLIIIPMICGDLSKAIDENRAFTPWIIRQYERGAEIAGLCVGSFFLASTGLLNGRSCSVHWAAQNDFKRMFPAVRIIPDKIITYENGIYTSGGSYSYLNLILCLIEKYTGRQISILVSKMFEIEIERKRQAPFVIFQGQKEHGDEPIRKVQDFIENNFSDHLSIDHLTSIVALSKRNFERRFKRATSNTVAEYIQRVRIESAKKGLEAGATSINDLMVQVGYTDAKAFRRVFRKVTGLSPVEYRKKYRSTEKIF